MRKFFFLLIPVLLLTACKSQPPVVPEIAEAVKEEPVVEVKEPEFNIVSIAIIQADLINTQFEAVVRIDNPNEFAVNLTSLSYKLYGNGKFWADGNGNDILHVPAQSSCETEFRFTMNFINMNRNLLDDIIAMREVRYRFKGEAEVSAAFSHVPSFITNFERSGLSEVRAKAGSKPPPEKVYTNVIRPVNQTDEFGNW